jgi:hypothetical protein
MFDFEKMSVYQMSLEIIECCAAATEKIPSERANG